jgi:hypothetical protein
VGQLSADTLGSLYKANREEFDKHPALLSAIMGRIAYPSSKT